jgi:carboxymethylenebutenolidase
MSAVEVLEVREIELPVGGRILPAALALPAGDRPWPGVLVLHELWGLNDDIRAHARRLAGEGYVALAPELYGPGRRRVCVARAVRDLRRGGELGLGRAGDAFRELCRLPEVDASRAGAIGFCLGGGFALLLGARESARAVSVNYGRVPARREELDGICPVVASYGGRDRQLRAHAERLERFLGELAVPHDVKTYPEAGHSFLNRSLPPALARALRPLAVVGYRPQEAEDAWRRILAFFRAHLDASERS